MALLKTLGYLLLLISWIVRADGSTLRREKRAEDFFSNLGTQLSHLINSFVGVRNGPANDPGEPGLLTMQSSNDPVRGSKSIRAGISLPSKSQIQRGRGVFDGDGKLNYCNDNQADCSYLSCLAENFQRSEQADTLKMAGKVFLDRKLRRAVANDPMISKAACDKVGLDERGCDGFKQLLGLFDQFDRTGSSEDEFPVDPEAHGRRRRGNPDYYGEPDVSPTSGPVRGQGSDKGPGQRSGSGRPHPDSTGRHAGDQSRFDRLNQRFNRRPPPPPPSIGPHRGPDDKDGDQRSSSSSSSSSSSTHTDYTDYYGHSSETDNEESQIAYKPRDCNQIVRPRGR